MTKFDSALVITHIEYRDGESAIPSDGPYGPVCDYLSTIISDIQVLELPLNGFTKNILYGKWKLESSLRLPVIFGMYLTIKYLIDLLIVMFFLVIWNLKKLGKKKIVIGIDPLSTLPMFLFRNLFGFTQVFYSVDFNRKRFKSVLLQKMYEKADEISSRTSDQVWGVSKSLNDYKAEKYGVRAIYVPNSVTFDSSIYKKNKKFKKGNTIIWVGTLMTKRLYGVLFELLRKIQKIRPDLKIILAPTRDIISFKRLAREYDLKNVYIKNVKGRKNCIKLVAKCDVGIAVYDEQFGSTEFIEPMKIWDFVLGGIPFIISFEPSISLPILKSGVAFRLNAHNEIPSVSVLDKFLSTANLKNKSRVCLQLAQKYSVDRQIRKALSQL